MLQAKNRFCSNHPDRAGFALCVSCKRTLCQECATQWDGMYHCVACLAKKRDAAGTRGSLWGWLALGASIAILFGILTRTMVWVSAFIAELL